MISKTKESGRADLLIRMEPELKERIEKAARLVGMTKTEWVLQAIEAILHVQELQAEAQEEILEIRGKQEAKFEEILATLAAEQKLGDLATMTKKDRAKLEPMADKQLENWRSVTRRYGILEAKTKLDRLCKEFDDLWDEARQIRDEQIHRDNIERTGRIFGGDWDWDKEESEGDWDTEESEEEYPDVIEANPGGDKGG
jgi:predicted DNA-binding protein